VVLRPAGSSLIGVRGRTSARFRSTACWNEGGVGERTGSGQRESGAGLDLSGNGRLRFFAAHHGWCGGRRVSEFLHLTGWFFEEDYALAINSEVKSQMFVTHESGDVWASLRFNRYQDFQSASVPGDEVRILHLPTLEVEAADRRLGGAMSVSPVLVGLQRVRGGRVRASIIRISGLGRGGCSAWTSTAPFNAVGTSPGGRFRPDAALRETWYGKSQFPVDDLDQIPVVRRCGPAANRCRSGVSTCGRRCWSGDFSAPWLPSGCWGGDMRHTIEPDVSYRYVTGINNFQQVLRFDDY